MTGTDYNAMAMSHGLTTRPRYQEWASQLARLGQAVEELARQAAALKMPLPHNDEWYQLLRHKLLPQVEGPPILVVAVVGGTNIGKSAIFNRLAGEAASRTSPLAAGTRHPVCLVPPAWAKPEMLARLFEGFELKPWHSADDPLADAPEHRLFWRVSDAVPERLLLLDTPDIDSDAKVNWQRAEVIRQAADVLLAVLTQQKYNDAAVKQFFRKAAEADKPVIVVFNQCDLVEDRPYWPVWLKTFTSETGVSPEGVYVVPYDRRAAAAGKLPFYDVGAEGTGQLPDGAGCMDACGPSVASGANGATPLGEHLAGLDFDALKWRACHGALGVVVKHAPEYLERLRSAAQEFRSAVEVLSASKLARVQWPDVPSRLLVKEARAWWDKNRPPWSRRIHDVYRHVGGFISGPLAKIWTRLRSGPKDPLAAFRDQERRAMREAVEGMVDELERLAELGNATLRERLQGLIGGRAREKLLTQLERDYQTQGPLETDLPLFVNQALEALKQMHPTAYEVLRCLDQAAAMLRPAVSIVLAITGAVGAGELVGQAAGHTAVHLVVEGAAAMAATAAGDTTITGALEQAWLLLQKLQRDFAVHRGQWLATWLEQHWLDSLFAELSRGASLPACEPFLDAEDALRRLSAF